MIDSDEIVEIPLYGEQAGEALVRLARHIPVGVEIGRPKWAGWNEAEMAVIFLTPVAAWWSYPASAVRYMGIGELTELTHWIGGREIQRVAGREGNHRPLP